MFFFKLCQSPALGLSFAIIFVQSKLPSVSISLHVLLRSSSNWTTVVPWPGQGGHLWGVAKSRLPGEGQAWIIRAGMRGRRVRHLPRSQTLRGCPKLRNTNKYGSVIFLKIKINANKSMMTKIVTFYVKVGSDPCTCTVLPHLPHLSPGSNLWTWVLALPLISLARLPF